MGRKPRVVTAMNILKQMLVQYDLSLSAGLSFFLLDMSLVPGIKVALVQRSCLWVLTQQVPIHLHSSTDKLRHVTMDSIQIVLQPWRFLRQVGAQIWQ